MSYDLAIVGGGPAGLALAIEASRLKLSVIVLERREWPVDKACGEGLMPAGLAILERLGVLPFLDRAETGIFEQIVWVQENGARVSATLPSPGGLGIRRLALSSAMAAAARAAGAELRSGVAVRSHQVEPGQVVLQTDAEPIIAKVVVAADGLNSMFRRALHVERPWAGPKRFGLRRHVAVAPWARAVEVHFADGVEAYLTPAGQRRVGVAFLWHDGTFPEDVSFETMLARFPTLKARLSGVPFDSEVRGAGPLRQGVVKRAADRVVLLGDAAGYVDAITGEGLTLAFEAAEALARELPEAIASGATAVSFKRYERTAERLFSRYERLASLLVWAARHPGLRRLVLNFLAMVPAVFGVALRRALPGPAPASPHKLPGL